MKIRITEGEFLHSDNVWGRVVDQLGRVLVYQSQRRVRGSLIELTYK